ncbi:MAG: DMT family transporter [Rhodospirillales bacterium]|nr:DMT family transporter [Rhodospirillales bacterium]
METRPPEAATADGTAASFPRATLRGVVFMALSTLALTVMTAVMRYLTAEMHPFEISFLRNVFGFLMFLPWFVRQGWGPLRTGRLGFHALRGVLQAVAMMSFLYGLSTIVLAKAVALDFSAPLFATVIAVFLLGERIRARRVAALILGLAGTLAIVRPGFIALETGSLLVLFGAFCWGFALIAIKVLARTDSSVTITLYSTIFIAPITLIGTLFVWQMPTGEQFAWLVLAGVLSNVGLMLQAQAIKECEVTAIMPLDFLKLVWAAVIGFVVFSELADLWTWIGGIMIFGASTYIAYRESRVRAERREAGT